MTKRLPVAVFMWVMQPMIASATSCGSTTRFSGTAWARFSSAARSRPGTKSVATEAGDTHRKRIYGPNTRASDIVMVSSAAFAAQYAMLDPEPVNAETDDTLTTTPSPETFSSGTSARPTRSCRMCGGWCNWP